ncbi:PRIC2 protein, partial [Eolophus roseicapillus]|nr:PRIC2 protein [Eolophus roseicapilla]
WHLGHFCCFECEGPLGGGRYLLRHGRAYCPPCHQAQHTHLCDACAGHIGPDQPHMTHRGQHWHALPGCFCCAACGRPLLGLPFLPRGGRLFCSRLCWAQRDPPPAPQNPPARRSWGGGTGPPAG